MCQTINTSNGGMVASVEATTTSLGQAADINFSNLSRALFRKRAQRCSRSMSAGIPPTGCWTVYFKRSKAPRRRRWTWRPATLTNGATSCLPIGKVAGSFVGYSEEEGGGCVLPLDNLTKARHGVDLDGTTRGWHEGWYQGLFI